MAGHLLIYITQNKMQIGLYSNCLETAIVKNRALPALHPYRPKQHPDYPVNRDDFNDDRDGYWNDRANKELERRNTSSGCPL
ncbi:Uncharacterised protein [Acinetobacter baumannii]|uniref:hypothetical protein n=2 Tax=Acinetobacter baumannii TaxID=470 RepID=UPI00046DAAFB|nr:hypothetical protein [Acinetobacter baumannii]MCX3036248.1 hypothetical protein [Acinetobacter baumannii]MDC4329294.1 hypothetical protein [Acinetobacter baumannii]MDC4333057.1 hypothetical protein [Acinetobacter baumannii]MDC4392994.1 hypothetical protein [Acinetobacter baumannii]MDC4438195.1 hypothetical protein [Acinetobacter baumannii]